MLERLAWTPLSKGISLAGLGFGLELPLWFLVTVVPNGTKLPTLLASAATSSFLVWLSLSYLAEHSFPRWPRALRMRAALGLYFLVGVPLAFFISWIRSLQGVQFNFWLDPEFGALVLLAWPFMIPLMIVFTPI